MDACPYDTAASCFPGWSGAPNWWFCLKLGSCFGRKYTVLIKRGLDMLSEAIPIIIIHLRKVRKHSSTNGCRSLWHSVAFPRLIWSLKLVILVNIWCCFCKNDTVLAIRRLGMMPEALPAIAIYLSKGGKHSSSNGCQSLWHSATFPGLIWCPKLVILLEIWDFLC